MIIILALFVFNDLISTFQFPLLIKEAPEGYRISAYVTLFIQIGNLAAFICVTVFIVMKVKNFKYPIIIFLALATAISVFLAFFRNLTVVISGSKKSIALYILSFFSGGVASALTITIFPFASLYGITHITAVSTGSGCSGLITSILSAIQQPSSKHPYFTFEIFFWITLILILLSILCFIIIIKMKAIQKFHISNRRVPEMDSHEFEMSTSTSQSLTLIELFSRIKYYAINQMFVSILYYIILSSLPFTVRSFGDFTNRFLFMTTIFGLSMGSIGRLITTKWRVHRVLYLSLIQIGPFIYLFSMCFLKGNHSPAYFGWMVVTFFSLQSFLFGLEDTSNYQNISTLFEYYPDIEMGTRQIAISNQVGAFIGSVIGFCLSLYAF